MRVASAGYVHESAYLDSATGERLRAGGWLLLQPGLLVYIAGLGAIGVSSLFSLGPLRDGDELAFTYVPGTGTRVTVRNSDGATIAGLAFARALFLVWLGDHPPSTDLRSALLGR